MRKNDGLVCACEVLWGEWSEIGACEALMEKLPSYKITWNAGNLISSETPESALLKKDAILSLPNECRIFAEIILSLPEEMFLVNGRMKKTAVSKFVREKTGWSREKISRIQTKLIKHLSQ